MYNKKDLLGLKDLSKNELEYILQTTEEMEKSIELKDNKYKLYADYSVMSMFYENSTRTKLSFVTACNNLGINCIDMNVSTSSVNKGESLIDTLENIEAMNTDLLIVRHSMTGTQHIMAQNSNMGIINAGDGTNEHPTQALLDMATIRKYKKNIDGLKVAIVGDILHSRVARSNAYGLTTLGANVTFGGASTLVSEDMKCLGVRVTNDITEAITDADVIMGLRVQNERQKTSNFPSNSEYNKFFGIHKDMLKYAKEDAIIMHPGPVNRGVEMDIDVIEHNQSVILPQVTMGVYVRMAVIKILLDNRK